MALHAVVDAGAILLRNLADSPAFASVNKYCLTREFTDKLPGIGSGVTTISALDEMVEWKLAPGFKRP